VNWEWPSTPWAAEPSESDLQAAEEYGGEEAARRLKSLKVIVDVLFSYGTLAQVHR
jgi:hypothetical protein